MELASFDIFDTTLIRKCGEPDNIFYLLANRLFPNDRALREDFLLWRKRAEQQARQRFPQTDVTLQQIYDNDELSGFTAYTPTQMLETEIEIESENLVANPAIKEVIEEKRKEGYTVCSSRFKYTGHWSGGCRSLRCLSIKFRQGGMSGAWIGVGQAVDFNRIHISRPHSVRRSFS